MAILSTFVRWTKLSTPARRAADLSARRARRAASQSRASTNVIRGYVIFDESFFDQFFVRLLIVHPDFRRRGLATALMRAAELDCQTGKLFTSTNQSNLPMQQLCARLGFVKSGYIENLDEGDPELIYVKLLAPGT